MGRTQTFQEFLATHAGEVSLAGLSANLLLTALLCALLAFFYIRFGTTLTNRRTLAKTFVLVGITTTLIITVVKSSLALSLGLVGALSVVRFRAAIKEPEELGYLFLTIAIGLGFGADQRMVTIVSFVLILGTVFLYDTLSGSSHERSNLLLTLSTRPDGSSLDVEGVVALLRDSCQSASLRRFEELGDRTEAIFDIVVGDFSEFASLRNTLQQRFQGLDLTFVEDVRLT